MKTHHFLSCVRFALTPAFIGFCAPLAVLAQGTAFTYQGRLADASGPVSGSYDLAFALFASDVALSPLATPVTNSAILVSNGLFATIIDFGPGVLTGGSNWLEIAVRTNGAATFKTLAPRQLLTPVPLALFANSASALIGALSLPSAGPHILVGGGSLLISQSNLSDFFAGSAAGAASVSGAQNTGIGASALSMISAGYGNTALGYAALGSNSTGYGNTAVGCQSLSFSIAAFGNTGIGYQSLVKDSLGVYNTATGSGALYGNVLGAYNTADGAGALQNNTNASYNTAIGYASLINNLSASQNTALGASSLLGLTNGGGNVALGYDALFQSQSGSNNIAVGAQAGANLTGHESQDILIGNPGVPGEGNAIRIGVPGVHANAVIAGVISGDGSGLTNLNAANIASGSISDSALSANVAFRSGGNTFSGDQIMNGFLGVGTVPIRPFQVFNGGILLAEFDSSNPDGAWLTLSNSSVTGDPWNFICTGSGNGEGADKLLIHHGYGGATVMTCETNGSIGVGTSDPETAFHVAGQNGTAIRVSGSGGGGAHVSLDLSTYDPATNLPACQFLATDNNWSSDVDIMTKAPGADTNSLISRIHISASGNVGIGTNAPANPLEMASGAYCSAGGVWTSVSDRNVKEGFAGISPLNILAKISQLPITQWKYKAEPPGVKHIGPVAQDFHAAFGVGADDKHIADIDEGGVALAAIKGLNEKLEIELTHKDAEIADLNARLQRLEKLLPTQDQRDSAERGRGD